MLVKTHGVVLNYIKYRESSVIVKIFTQELGLQSYIVNSVNSPKSSIKLSHLQPLTILDMVVYHKEKQNIHRISELKCKKIYQHLHTHPVKRSTVLFITEILTKTLSDGELNPDLYDFLEDSLLGFDIDLTTYKYFHLQFLYEYMHITGIHPQSIAEFSKQLMAHSPDWGVVLSDESITFYIINLLEGLPVHGMDNHTAALVLDLTVGYYQCHFTNLGVLKTLSVFREL